QVRDREPDRDPRAGDRRDARAAVGVQDIAVDRDRALAERAEIDRGAQRAADQPLDLLAAAARIALATRVGRARQHRVLGGEPALPLAGEERRHAVLDRRRAQDVRVAELDERRAFGVLLEAGLDRERAELIGASSVGAHGPRSLSQTRWARGGLPRVLASMTRLGSVLRTSALPLP